MKLTIEQSDLRGVLERASVAIPARSPLPIAMCVLIEADAKSGIRFTGTDLQTTVVTRCHGIVEEPGEAALPARLLSDYVRTLPSGLVQMELAAVKGKTAGQNMLFRADAMSAEIRTSDPEDFPHVPKDDLDERSVELDAEAAVWAIERTAFCASREDGRPILKGLHCHLEGETLTLAAADGYRMAVTTSRLAEPLGEDQEPIRFTIDAATLSRMTRHIARSGESVRIGLDRNESKAIFQTGDMTMYSAALHGDYPDYRRLVPQSSASTVLIDADSLRGATRTSAAFVGREQDSIRFVAERPDQTDAGETDGQDYQKTPLTIWAQTAMGQTSGELDVELSGASLKTAINASYLKDALEAIDTSHVEIGTNGGLSPILIKPSASRPSYNRSGEAQSVTQVVMPRVYPEDEYEEKEQSTQ